MGRHQEAWEGMGRQGTAWEGMGRDGKAQEDMERQEDKKRCEGGRQREGGERGRQGKAKEGKGEWVGECTREGAQATHVVDEARGRERVTLRGEEADSDVEARRVARRLAAHNGHAARDGHQLVRRRAPTRAVRSREEDRLRIAQLPAGGRQSGRAVHGVDEVGRDPAEQVGVLRVEELAVHSLLLRELLQADHGQVEHDLHARRHLGDVTLNVVEGKVVQVRRRQREHRLHLRTGTKHGERGHLQALTTQHHADVEGRLGELGSEGSGKGVLRGAARPFLLDGNAAHDAPGRHDCRAPGRRLGLSGVSVRLQLVEQVVKVKRLCITTVSDGRRSGSSSTPAGDVDVILARLVAPERVSAPFSTATLATLPSEGSGRARA